jgi:hypothetical protein
VTFQQRAENCILRAVQNQHFKEELLCIRKDKSVKCGSSLYRLNPFVDKEGLLRVGGRIHNADLPTSEKHPVILPKDSPVTTLIVNASHCAVAHQGRGMTINHLRSSGYCIIGCRRLVSSLVCRKLRGKPQEQQMADLPEDRLQTALPFTYCGVDYFGPFYIKEKRSEVKRYGVIFTCLNSRAIHLEVASSMKTDAFIMALRRFLAICGPVRLLTSLEQKLSCLLMLKG